MRYAAQQSLAEPARPTAQLWRLGLGILLLVVLVMVLSRTYFNLLAEIVTAAEWPAFAREIDAGSTPRGMMALLGMFGMITLALMLVVNQLHRRRMRSLVGPWQKTSLDFIRVSIALGALSVLLWLLPDPAGMAPLPGLPPLRWAALLPLALPLIFLQTSAEELVFRGYLQSQLAARFASPAIWVGVPALLFGLLHYDPATGGANAPVFVLSAFLFGLAAADLTARSGSLGAAFALHFYINASAFLVTAPLDHHFGLALQLLPFAMSDPAALGTWLPYDTLVMLCAWLCARLAIAG